MVLVALWFALGAGAALAQSTSPVTVASSAEQIVGNFRRVIVLHDVAGRGRSYTQAGQYLFFHNRELTSQLVQSLLAVPREKSEQYPPARIMDEIKTALPAAEQHTTPSPKDNAVVDNALRDEWTDGGLPPKTVPLTFDDGPHPRFTAEILQILAHYGSKAVFFQVGQGRFGLFAEASSTSQGKPACNRVERG
jgi:hypothetical protein